MPPPAPPLADDLVEKILLRLPADSPASLAIAGLVCKRWCRLVSDHGFHRRFRDFHRRAPPPPILGFLAYSHHDDATRFVPTSPPASGSSSGSGGGLLMSHANHRGLKPCDSRHGRVLLHATAGDRDYASFRVVVWNPTTGEQLRLPDPPRWDPYQWTAAVLCAAATATSSCDHFDCHGRPFIVVLVGTQCYRNFVCIYSSEAGVWNEPTFAPHSGGSIQRSVRSAFVENTTRTLCFLLREYEHPHPYRNILEYNLCTRKTSVVRLPEVGRCRSIIRPVPLGPIEFTAMEDGRLGFVRLEDSSTLCLWSREVGEPDGWVLCKSIELGNLLPYNHDQWQWANSHYLAGSVEGVGIIFLTFKDECFTVDLRSGRITKVYKHGNSCLTVPYISFCTPVFRAPSSLINGPKNEYSK